MKIGILDRNFIKYQKGCSPLNAPKLLEWVDISTQKIPAGPIFFTDYELGKGLNVSHPRKIAWLVEPRAIIPNLYSEQNIRILQQNFSYVITHEESLVRKYKNFLYAPFCADFTENKDHFEKSKTLSFITSNKNHTEGHKFRLSIVSRIKGYDLFGKGFKDLKVKNEGLDDYRFSIAVENSFTDFYFTEKLIDCFSTKTIPIYFGCKVSKWFNDDGIIYFDTLTQLNNIIPTLTSELYESKRAAIEENFMKARTEFSSPEDYIVRNYPFLFKS